MKASAANARDQPGYDRSGVITMRCRHSILLSIADVTGGEKFSYSLDMLRPLCAKYPDLERLWYDVGDKRLDAAMRRYPEFEKVRPLLPRLHARMHNIACQLLWDGLTVLRAGLPNSELSEQENRRLGLVRTTRGRDAATLGCQACPLISSRPDPTEFSVFLDGALNRVYGPGPAERRDCDRRVSRECPQGARPLACALACADALKSRVCRH